MIPGEHHMKYLHLRKEFLIHPLAVDDQINRTETIWIRVPNNNRFTLLDQTVDMSI